MAKEKSPAIIFIDELDAIGTKRFDSEKAGDREVQRTMLELLNQLDGFSSTAEIKVSGNTLITLAQKGTLGTDMFYPCGFLAGNQGNHQNFDPSLIPI